MGGPAPVLADQDFIRLFNEYGPAEISRRTGVGERNVLKRREVIELRYGIQLRSPNGTARAGKVHCFLSNNPQRIYFDVVDGIVLVGSDAHKWPSRRPAIWRGFVKLCREMEPAAAILNGDVIDAAAIGYPSMQWETRPVVQQEIEAAQGDLHEVKTVLHRRSRTIWTLGNHDARFEKRLAHVAPEYAKVHGVHLKDHFPGWEPCYSVYINDKAGPGGVIVKHRFKGGVNAARNNAIYSGRTLISGHLHSAHIHPFSDENGDRYGVDTGFLEEKDGPQFAYTEDNTKDWRSAFCVLTFVDGVLLQPELVLGFGPDHIQFRGKIIDVSEPKAPRAAKVPHAEASRAKAKKPRGRGRRR